MPRRLIDLKVDFIALVKKPANDKPVLLKSGTARTFKLQTADDEKQRVYGIVYSPEPEDLQGDITDDETIRKAANRFMREGLQNNIDLEHSFSPEPETYVAESWLVQKGDPHFPDEPVGSWAVGIQIEKAAIWGRFKAGELAGLSLAGNATAKSADNDVPSWFQRLLNPQPKTDDTMTKEEVSAIGVYLMPELHPLVQVAKGMIAPQDLRVGGELRPEAAERVISMLEKDEFLSKVQTTRMRRTERDIEVLDITPRQLKRLPQGVVPANTDSTNVEQKGSKLIALPTQLFAKIKLDTLRDNADNSNLVSMVNGMLNTAYSNDLVDLSVNGIGEDASEFIKLNKGWVTIASEAAGSPKITINPTGDGWIDTLGAIKAKSEVRFRPTSVFVRSPNDADAYDLEVGKHVTGVPLISNGNNRQEFLRQPIVTHRYMPAGKLLYTPIKNLVFGINTLMRRDSAYDIDERVIKIVIDMACDFEIAIKEACVLAST